MLDCIKFSTLPCSQKSNPAVKGITVYDQVPEAKQRGLHLFQNRGGVLCRGLLSNTDAGPVCLTTQRADIFVNNEQIGTEYEENDCF